MRFLLALAFLISLMAGASTPPAPSSFTSAAAPHPISSPFRSATTVLPAIVPVSPLEQAHEESEAKVTLLGRAMKLTDAVIAGGTIISAVATVVLAIVTTGLWRVTRKLWEETARAGETTKQAVEAGNISAEAARKSADLAQMLLKSEHPFWSVQEMRFSGVRYDAKEKVDMWEVTIGLVHRGGRPAEITRSSVGYAVGTLPPCPDYGDETSDQHRSFGNVVKVDEQHKLSLAISLSEEDRSAIVTRRKTLWVYGYIGYKDTLDQPWVKGFLGELDRSRVLLSPTKPADEKGSRTTGVATGIFIQPLPIEHLPNYVFDRPDVG